MNRAELSKLIEESLLKDINLTVEEYKEKIKDIPDENIVYVDETGIDSFYYREFGYAKRGTKVYQKISGRKFQRTNIVSAMCGNSIISPVQYSCDGGLQRAVRDGTVSLLRLCWIFG